MIRAIEIGTSKKGKTKVWEIRARGRRLGVVRWLGSTRRYSFVPESMMIAPQHRADIDDFCDEQTRLKRADHARSVFARVK